MVIEFTAFGEPKGQPRPRAFAMRMGNGKFQARVFDAGTAEGWKSCVVAAAHPHRPAKPIDGPVSLELNFIFRRPKAHYYTGKRANEVRDNAPFEMVGKPDADNLAKAVMDAITQFGGFWHDDAQVAHLVITKEYTAEGSSPGVVVRIQHSEP